MSSLKENTIQKLIHDQKFFDWVVKPTEELNIFWENYIHQNPLEESNIEEARDVIKGMVKKETGLTERDIEKLWNKIDRTIFLSRNKIILLTRWRVVAGIVLLLGISAFVLYRTFISNIPSVDYASVTRLEPSDNDITLFLSDSKRETFSANDIELQYDEHGSIKTGSGKVLNSDIVSDTKSTEQLNQLVVPFGKHSNILLSDGTKLWLNSGSRAIYPVAFNKRCREIYIEGEAYLEVAHNPSQPFYVKTDNLKVKVLGTKFNVSAYPDDFLSSVVLVEGSVEATVGKENVIIKPDQILALKKNSGEISLRKTNVMEYISWKDGWLLCNKEKLESIISKLSRYYNISIEVKDTEINALTLSGKLDLKTECTDVLNTIASTAPVRYERIDNNTIRISIK